VRATGPIVGPDGRVVALVSAGTLLDAIGADLTRALPGIVGTGLVTLAVGTTGSWLISRRLRRQTHGLGAPALARMLDYYQAVLHAVREGLLLLDGDRRVRLVNDEARRLLALDDEPAGRHVSELGLSRSSAGRWPDSSGSSTRCTSAEVASSSSTRRPRVRPGARPARW
jgi:sensor histidine kinase regulating citrate/malate metabolism